jgi:hypothetical protein
MGAVRGNFPAWNHPTGLLLPLSTDRMQPPPPSRIALAMASRSMPPATHSGTALPSIFWKRATTSGAQAILGHKDIQTTTIYTHLRNPGGLGVRRPVDAL